MLDCLTVLDFETTGFDPAVGYVTEIGAVRLRAGEVTSNFQTLVNFGGPVPANITALTGITSEMCARGKEPRHAFALLRNFIGADVVVCHNAAFDMSWLAASYERYGASQPLGSPFLCTALLAQHYWPELQSLGADPTTGKPYGPHSLVNLCLHYDIDRERGHRALEDAQATAKLLTGLLDKAQFAAGSWLAAEPFICDNFLNTIAQPYHGRGSRAVYEQWLPAYARRVGDVVKEGGQS